MGISQRTVRFHVQNILVKLGVHDRRDAATRAQATQPAGLAKGALVGHRLRAA